MLYILSLITSLKDYTEILHKLLEYDRNANLGTYADIGPLLTYFIFSLKQFLLDFIGFQWFQHIWSIPLIVPDIASAMISEISVFGGYFQNAFPFLEAPLESYGSPSNFVAYVFSKFCIGLLNSGFLWLPTSMCHVIIWRRFFMQGVDAGFMAGLGTLVGNLVWFISILFGLRFLVIPWLSLEFLRYILGFLILMGFLWKCIQGQDRRMLLTPSLKRKIFGMNFLLAMIEQTTVFPFLGNIALRPEGSLFETFPVSNFSEFVLIHGAYILGIGLGGLSLLYFTCWLWENPVFDMYRWVTFSLKVTTNQYYKYLHLGFLYVTLFLTFSSIPYYGLDYAIANPVGYVYQDKLFGYTYDPKDPVANETRFLSTKPNDINTRVSRGRRQKPERWKSKLERYRKFETSVREPGTYDIFTIEDLNYGFERFWSRRKIRRHKPKFRVFGPFLMKIKKQFAKPVALQEPQREYMNYLVNHAYNPTFHKLLVPPASSKQGVPNSEKQKSNPFNPFNPLLYLSPTVPEFGRGVAGDSKEGAEGKETLSLEFQTQNSILRKLNRKLSEQIISNKLKTEWIPLERPNVKKAMYSKEGKKRMSNARKDILNSFNSSRILSLSDLSSTYSPEYRSVKKTNTRLKLSKKEKQLVRNEDLPHPLPFYLEKEKAFQRKLDFYGVKLSRAFSHENRAPFFRVMMKRLFGYYKPSLRRFTTASAMKKRFLVGKKARIPLKRPSSASVGEGEGEGTRSLMKDATQTNEGNDLEAVVWNRRNGFQQAQARQNQNTSSYSISNKRITRYRAKITKDVLQHWYYTPLNRLFLRSEVDSFIRRQPVSHFVTPKEERLLHLRRFLLSEHYNTLRWYTFMQHYRSMKTKIGGTKSFASKMYNQQFQGTLKKIRHLFAITPTLQDQSVLKFDQPLYNEYKNTQNNRLVGQTFLHEELFDDVLAENPFSQATQPLRHSLAQNVLMRKEVVQNMVNQKYNWDITSFMLNSPKQYLRQTFQTEKHFDKKILISETVFMDKYKDLLKDKLGVLEKSAWIKLLATGAEGGLTYPDLSKNKIAIENRIDLQELELFLDEIDSTHDHYEHDPSKFDRFAENTMPSGIQKSIKDSLFVLQNKAQSVHSKKQRKELAHKTVDTLTNNVYLPSLPRTQIKDKDKDKESSDFKKFFQKRNEEKEYQLNKGKNLFYKQTIYQKFTKKNVRKRLTHFQKRPRPRTTQLKELSLSFDANDVRNMLETPEPNMLETPEPGIRPSSTSSTKSRTSLYEEFVGVFWKRIALPGEDKIKMPFERITTEAASQFAAAYKPWKLPPEEPGRPHRPFEIDIKNLKEQLKKKGKMPFDHTKRQKTGANINTFQNHYWQQRFQKSEKGQRSSKYNDTVERNKTSPTGPRITMETLFERKQARMRLQKWWWQNELPQLIANKNVSQNQFKLTQELIQKDLELQRMLEKTSGEENTEVVSEIYKQILFGDSQRQRSGGSGGTFFAKGTNSGFSEDKKRIVDANPLPFYAGWDEESRKFVVTNRFLSRNDSLNSFSKGTNSLNHTNSLVLFSAFDQENIFREGRSAYAPIAWRRFEFRHTLWKYIKNMTTQAAFVTLNTEYSNTRVLGAHPLYVQDMKGLSSTKKVRNKRVSSRVAKLYKNRNEWNQPHFDVSGPRVYDVLPIHYVLVALKVHTQQLEANRYLSPSFRNDLDLLGSFARNTNDDYTLRRNVKSRRKGHKVTNSIKKDQVFNEPRRRRFIGNTTEAEEERWRPTASETLSGMPIKKRATLGKRALFKKRNAYAEREYRHVIKPRIPLQLYKGGLLWPEDYYRLQYTSFKGVKGLPKTYASLKPDEISLKEPKPKPIHRQYTTFARDTSLETKTTATLKGKMIKETKPEAQTAQTLEPRKNLMKKQNLKVIKKRLQKAERQNVLAQKVAQLKNRGGIERPPGV